MENLSPRVQKLLDEIYQRDTKGMRRIIEQNFKIADGDTEGHYYYARFLEQQRKTMKAIEEYKRTISNPTKTDDYVGYQLHAYERLAELLESLKRYDEVEKIYQQWIEFCPNDTVAMNNFASFLLDRNKADDAEKWYRQILKFEPNDLWAYAQLAELLGDTNRKEEAIACCKKGLKRKPSVKRYGEEYIEDARTELKKLLRLLESKVLRTRMTKMSGTVMKDEIARRGGCVVL